MLLTITTTHQPATDLGYLLHKRPGKLQTFDLAFGRAHVFYPAAEEARCTAALLLDIDPLALVRGPGAMLSDYVNDRPYVSSSFLCVAISRVFGTALSGRCSAKPELAAAPIPLEAQIAAVPLRGREQMAERLFEPLGYQVEATAETDAGGRYHNVTLRGTKRLSELLTHIYVMLPVADNRKHYGVGAAEVDKLLDKGKGWLDEHPEREFIVRRYLAHRRVLTEDAATRLRPAGEEEAEETIDETPSPEQKRLHDQRLDWAVETLKGCGAARVLDYGCGEGRLTKRLAGEACFTEIVGAEVSTRSLEYAERRLRRLRREGNNERVRLVHSGLTYRDRRLAGYDVAAVIEVVEHVDPQRLDAFERALFEHAKPRTIALTTPNREYNARFERLGPSGLRHRDHRFEWTRAEFAEWAAKIAGRHGYRVETGGIGEADPEIGPPSLSAVFERSAS